MNDNIMEAAQRFYALLENNDAAGAMRFVEEFDEANPGNNFDRSVSETMLMSTLSMAAQNGAVELVEFLLHRAAKARLDTSDLLDTALQFANNAEMVDALVAAGGNVHATSGIDRTPLHFAAEDNRVDVIEGLVRNGANIEAKDYVGQTSAIVAAHDGRPEALKALADFGADLKTVDDKDCDACWHTLDAAKRIIEENEATNCLSVLLDFGIDPRISGPKGKTPLEEAKARGLHSIVALIEAKSIELDNLDRAVHLSVKPRYGRSRTL